MAIEFLINRLKALIVLLLGILRQAMCCLRRRRRSSCDSIPLSAVGVVPNVLNNSTVSSVLQIEMLMLYMLLNIVVTDLDNSNHSRCLIKELEQWDQWEENPVVVVPDRPVNTIQAKIDQYRQQVSKSPETPTEEQQPNFFEDMTPKITKQTKILITDKRLENTSWNSSKFAVATDTIPTNELGVWEDNTGGWEEETAEEFGETARTLREQKRREREQRLIEQQQKRLERSARPQPLGAKLNS